MCLPGNKICYIGNTEHLLIARGSEVGLVRVSLPWVGYLLPSENLVTILSIASLRAYFAIKFYLTQT